MGVIKQLSYLGGPTLYRHVLKMVASDSRNRYWMIEQDLFVIPCHMAKKNWPPGTKSLGPTATQPILLNAISSLDVRPTYIHTYIIYIYIMTYPTITV